MNRGEKQTRQERGIFIIKIINFLCILINVGAIISVTYFCYSVNDPKRTVQFLGFIEAGGGFILNSLLIQIFIKYSQNCLLFISISFFSLTIQIISFAVFGISILMFFTILKLSEELNWFDGAVPTMPAHPPSWQNLQNAFYYISLGLGLMFIITGIAGYWQRSFRITIAKNLLHWQSIICTNTDKILDNVELYTPIEKQEEAKSFLTEKDLLQNFGNDAYSIVKGSEIEGKGTSIEPAAKSNIQNSLKWKFSPINNPLPNVSDQPTTIKTNFNISKNK